MIGTAARGGDDRARAHLAQHRSELRTASPLSASCPRTTAADSAASRYMWLTSRRPEFGDEVVGIATIVGLRKFDRAAVAQVAERSASRPGSILRAEELRLFHGQQHGAQALQCLDRAIAGALERFVQGRVHASTDGRQLASTVAYSSAIGASSAKRMRWNRYTGVPGLNCIVSASSGVTVPCERLRKTLRGLQAARAHVFRKRTELREIFLDTRLDESAGSLAPISRPSSTRPSMALRTVMRDTFSSSSPGPVPAAARRSARCARVDRALQHPLQLLVQRQPAAVVEAPQISPQGVNAHVPVVQAHNITKTIPLVATIPRENYHQYL